MYLGTYVVPEKETGLTLRKYIFKEKKGKLSTLFHTIIVLSFYFGALQRLNTADKGDLPGL